MALLEQARARSRTSAFFQGEVRLNSLGFGTRKASSILSLANSCKLTQFFMVKTAMHFKLIPPATSFVDAFYKWRGEENTVKFNPIKNISLNEAREILSNDPKNLTPLLNASTHRWFLAYKEELVGTFSLTEVNALMRTGQIGYTISAAHQGRGFATIGMQLWTQMLFDQTNLRKLTALVNENNGASLRVLEKCSFKREGFLREHFIIRDEPSNQILFGLLKSEWDSAALK